YGVAETQPAGYKDGKDTAGSLGGSTTVNDTISGITLAAGQNSVNNNFGELTPASISGFVYNDSANNNGLKETGEAAIAGVTVTLTGTDDLGASVTRTATTAADGSYSFTGLRPGSYTVTESQPSAYLDGKDTAGTLGGSTTSNDAISGITLKAGDASLNNNFGELTPASISGFVYNDSANNNGLKETGEAAIAGVTVTLTGTNDLGAAVTATTTTLADGSYSFNGLRPGSYQVAEEQPMQYLDGKDTAGSLGGDAVSVNDKISGITLKAGDASLNNNFGELTPASLSGYVYVDAGNDGIRGTSEAPIGGVTLKLLDSNGNVVLGANNQPVTTITNSSGYYEFTNLRPGTYGVAEVQPSNYQDGKDTIGSKGGTSANDLFTGIVLNAGDSSINNNFGELALGNAGVDIEKLVRGVYDEYTSGGGTEGFTPGYWKTHSIYGTACDPSNTSDWERTGYTENDKVNAIFGINLAGNPTLYQALSTTGGGVNALMRQAVSGLLNAANPNIDYLYSKEQVIAMTKQAISTGNYTTNKDLFQTENSKEIANAFDTPSSKGWHTVVTADSDADTAPGIYIPAGGKAVYTYVVKNTGNVELSNIQVTDDKIATLTFVGGDTDGDTRLDVNETWVYTAQEYVQTGLKTNIGTVVATNLVAGTTVTDSDAANYTVLSTASSASISGYVYNDANNDGLKGTAEAVIANATVTLTGTNDLGQAVTATATTDTNGLYLFAGLRAGTYAVTETQPNGWTDGKDTAGSLGGTVTNDKIAGIVLPAGGSSVNNNFGELVTQVAPTAQNSAVTGLEDTTYTFTKADFKFTDPNGDSLGSVTISTLPVEGTLKYNNGTTLVNVTAGQVITAADIAAGKLQFVPDLNESSAPCNAAGVGNFKQDYAQFQFSVKDSTGQASGAATMNIDITPDADAPTLTIQAAVVATPPASTGLTQQFYDNTTVVDTTVAGNVLNVESALQACAGPTSTTTVNAVNVATLGTDDAYRFTGLTYLETGKSYTLSGAWDDTALVKIGGNTVLQKNYNSWGNYTATTFTPSANGYYTVEMIAYNGDGAGNFNAKMSVNGAAAVDFNTTNFKLYSSLSSLQAAGGAYGALQANGDGGYYAAAAPVNNGVKDTFINLSDIASARVDTDGSETLALTISAIPVGAVLTDGVNSFTAGAGGTSAIVTNWNLTNLSIKPAAGFTGSFNLQVTATTTENCNNDTASTAGTITVNVTAPAAQLGSIGDKVWEDQNHNSIQDASEPGIGGVKVDLKNAAGAVLASTTTDANGNYLFTGLAAGDYFLTFDKANVIYKGINMNGWKWAPKDVGSNDAIDSDVTGDGVATTNVTSTGIINLSAGENDLTWDAGITPIVIDLNGDGIHSVARSASTGTFDLLGTGNAIHSGWLSGDDGFLAVDKNGNGSIDSINELFGGSSKGAGFAQLASYDSNHDGAVNASDADFASLLIWQDANGNHKTDAGELKSLADAGVTSLAVAHTDLPFVDSNGNLHLERSSATLGNGQAVDMTDLYFNVAADDAAAAGVNFATLAQLLGVTPTQVAPSAAEAAIAGVGYADATGWDLGAAIDLVGCHDQQPELAF
ncbi:MAG: SdrD B-like domain-containing protein, partial [Candidatus Methylumidiphilus sp.]